MRERAERSRQSYAQEGMTIIDTRFPNRFLTGIALVLAVSAVIAAPARAESGRTTVSLLYEPTDNPPHALGKGTAIDWRKPGVTLELLRLVEKRLGIRFSFKRVPWKRGLFLLQNNEADGLFHASYKPSRETIGVYPKKDGDPDPSRALFTQSYVLYKRAGSPLRWDGKALSPTPQSIGSVLDYSIAADLRQMGYHVEEARDLRVNFDKLVNGRIDAFAGLQDMSDAFRKTDAEAYRDVVKLRPPLSTKPYYLLLSRGFVRQNPELSERIWDTIRREKASAAFTAIVSRYH